MSWPDSFGDTTAEYVAAHDAAGYIGGQTGLFWATGPDTVSFLQGIITQDVESMPIGSVARSMLLEPRGKLASLMWLLRGEDRVGIVTTTDLLEETMSSLSRWRIRVDVEFEIDDRPVYDVWGPGAGQPDGWTDVDGVVRATLHRSAVPRAIVAGLTEDQLAEQGLVPLGNQTATTLRIEVGEPQMGVDVDEKTIPQESGLVDASVSFTKGCYLGQELVARIDSRGRVNRHLRAIRMTEPVIPPPGSEVRLDGDAVGSITSVGESLAVKAPVALGLIRREAEPGTAVAVVWDGGEVKAVVDELPLLD